MKPFWMMFAGALMFSLTAATMAAEIKPEPLPAILKPELRDRLRKVQLIVLDVDGTLTDGQVHYCNDMTFIKSFHVHDRIGIILAQRAGLEVAIVTGENTEMIRQRAQRLKIRHLITDCKAKRRAVEDLASGLHVPMEAVCFIGDDVMDEEAMIVSGFRACPSDAAARIQKLSDYVAGKPGGRGAVREVIEMILEAQGKPNTLSNLY